MFTVLEEDDMNETEPTSEDEDKDDQSPRARLLRGILRARRPVQEDPASEEDSSEDLGEAVRDVEAAPEDGEKLEPEKEKNPQPQAEETHLDYLLSL